MTDKDPKDMTAAELLREADSNPCSMCHLVMAGEEPCATTGCASWAYRLADKIDAELAQARKSGFDDFKLVDWYYSADANGWPKPRDDESLHEYVDRCFIPRPRFEDGEPVHIGDKAEHPYTGETCTIDCINTFDDSYCLGFVEERSASLCDGERVKRPAPEALGADGLPIVVGETVWDVESGIEGVVDNFQCIYGQSVTANIKCPDDEEFYNFNVDRLTHTPPDTQERIDKDVRKSLFDYWGCGQYWCDKCPSTINGETPRVHYMCNDCGMAIRLDLLRRQRELDKRTRGAE